MFDLQTYGIGGENLRGLTEKLRAVAHTLQMGIQSRWRRNSYDGRSTVRLPTGVLQVVVELITSAKGLFSLLNRSVKRELSNCYIYSTPNSILSCSYFLLGKCSLVSLTEIVSALVHVAPGFIQKGGENLQVQPLYGNVLWFLLF